MSRRVSKSKNHREPIPVVDLFAGPGGLGEGFSLLGPPTSPTFKIAVSAEMDPAAYRTLRLRAYYRALLRTGNQKLIDVYYDYCHGKRSEPHTDTTLKYWQEADREALNLKLGEPGSDRKLRERLDQLRLSKRPWVLVGGPPCQAYSLVGRSRNKGNKEYDAKKDHRHYLYREYLKVIQEYRPPVFVMENVKGLLSSKIDGESIFHSILRDLSDPGRALGKGRLGNQYRIHSLVQDACFRPGDDPKKIDARAFVIRAENYGVPQKRHRVILVGVRTDLSEKPSRLTPASALHTVREAIDQLPRLRSTLSREPDSPSNWRKVIAQHAIKLAKLARATDNDDLAAALSVAAQSELPSESGLLRMPGRTGRTSIARDLNEYFRDDRLSVWLNHEARGHMRSDLSRYLYAASFAQVGGDSPKGHEDFDVLGLAPRHKNWESGHFADRFRVQICDSPSTTITCHISKDGHYYIHPDPAQCRSLTVREAARLQTFPDNYFFEGNRTQQFVQVGNAVPPLLAIRLAEVVADLLGR